MFCTNGQIPSSLLAFTSFYLHGSIAVIGLAYDTHIYGSCSPSHVDHRHYLDASTALRTGCRRIDSSLIRGRRNCCGARSVGARTDFQPPHWQSALRPSPGVLRMRPGHLRRLRPGDAHSRVSDGVALHCSIASAAQHLSPHLSDRL